MATYTDNASNTSYKIDADATLIRKDLTVGNNAVVSGKLDVSGNTTLKTTSVTGPLTTPAGFSVDTSSNVVVKGTFNQPLFNTTSRMMQVGVPSSQDVYALASNNSSNNYLRPIFELDTNVNVRVFADSSNSKVADDFVSQAQAILPPTGKIMYYDTPGTKDFPIDGTAGTSLYSAIPAVIGTPKFADITDASAYKFALSKIYSNAPTITDLSGNIGGGVPQKLVYSSYVDPQFSYEGMKNSVQKSGLYYASRGWEITPPAYIPLDVSGNPDDLNFFSWFGGGANFSFEFIYGTNKLIPANVCIQYALSTGVNASILVPGTKNVVGPLQIGSIADQSSNRCVIKSVNIPITTDPVVHGINIQNGVNSAYYNIGLKIIDISQVVPSSTTVTQGVTGLVDSYTTVYTFSSFSGTFAVMKKALSTYTLNNVSANSFISCNPNDPNAFIIQVSPNLLFTNDIVVNGIRSAGFPRSFNFTLTGGAINTNGFSGIIATRNGYGDIGHIIRTLPNSSFGSYASAEDQEIVNKTKGKDVGNNPYSNLYNYLTQAMSTSTEQSNSQFKYWGRTINYDSWATTPETMALYDASYYLYPTPFTIDTGILLHEEGHIKQFIYGNNGFVNGESDSATIEMDAARYLNAVSSIFARVNTTLTTSAHLYGQMRGYFPLTKSTGKATENLLTNPYTLGLTTNVGVSRFQTGILFSTYGENNIYLFIKDKYDSTQQVLRRYYELVNATATKYISDNGALHQYSLVNSYSSNFSFNDQITKFCYSQAVYDITGKRMDGTNNLITDYYISACFLRNNNSIPAKYQYPFPWWVSGSTNQAGPGIAQDSYNLAVNNFGGSTAYNLPAKTINFWTDLDRSIPIGTDRHGWKFDATASSSASSGGVGSYSWLDGKTFIPYWPRNIAGGDEKQLTLGSWTRDAQGYSGDFNYDVSGSGFVYNTAAYLTTKTYYVEDMAARCFILPVNGGPNLGVTSNNKMQSIDITVHRGSWDFSVVQYVPDASGVGSWTQLPSSGNVISVDVSGVWVDGSGDLYSNPPDSSGNVTTIPTSFSDVSGAEVTFNFNLTGLTVQQFGGFYYYPKLVCVNRGMYDFGTIKNIYPSIARYTGKITLVPSFIS